MKDSVVFSHLMDEYGSLDQEDEVEKKGNNKEGATARAPEDMNDKKAAALMQEEERNTGSVTWGVYTKYLHFAGGIIWAPVIFLLLTVTQGAQGNI